MPERTPYSFEQGYSPEAAIECSLESLDMIHKIESVLSLIIEGGPDLDLDYIARLHDYLDYLLSQLDIQIDDSDPYQAFRAVKEKVGVTDGMVDDVLLKHTLPEVLRQVVEKIIAGKHEGLSDKAIYRRLARLYHPDQTLLDPRASEEIFKLIGKLLYDERDGFARIFDPED